MALQLEIISEHREIVGDDAVREFIEDGGTIGRSLQNDWILPDPDKYISGRHATIDYKGGMYYLADVSSNGVYINDEDEPIGKGNPRRLFDGDRLRLGDFEITVSIDRGESIVMPLEEEQTVSPEPLEQAVDEVSLRTGMNLLEEEELTDDEEFESALFSSEKSEDEDFDAFDIAVNEASAIAALSDDEADQAKEVKVTSDDLFDTFLDGLGVNRGDLHPSVDPAEVMQNAGEVLKEFVDGMGKLLYSRANLKTAFKLDQTTVLPRHNNPLKLSENTMDSIMQLLVGREGEYLGPRDAVREVCRDLLFHQDAFLDAMSFRARRA
jgi:type VI secretion system protein ImpI